MKSLKIKFQLLLIVVFFTFAFSSELIAQKDKNIENLPDGCEAIAAKLDVTGNRFNKVGGTESYLIIIGDSPVKRGNYYNNKRISDAIKYFTIAHNIRNERIIYGVGSSLDRFAYLKFYVNGELISKIKTGSRSILCFGMGETFK